jgi:hypothetical protein
MHLIARPPPVCTAPGPSHERPAPAPRGPSGWVRVEKRWGGKWLSPAGGARLGAGGASGRPRPAPGPCAPGSLHARRCHPQGWSPCAWSHPLSPWVLRCRAYGAWGPLRHPGAREQAGDRTTSLRPPSGRHRLSWMVTVSLRMLRPRAGALIATPRCVAHAAPPWDRTSASPRALPHPCPPSLLSQSCYTLGNPVSAGALRHVDGALARDPIPVWASCRVWSAAGSHATGCPTR